MYQTSKKISHNEIQTRCPSQAPKVVFVKKIFNQPHDAANALWMDVSDIIRTSNDNRVCRIEYDVISSDDSKTAIITCLHTEWNLEYLVKS